MEVNIFGGQEAQEFSGALRQRHSGQGILGEPLPFDGVSPISPHLMGGVGEGEL